MVTASTTRSSAHAGESASARGGRGIAAPCSADVGPSSHAPGSHAPGRARRPLIADDISSRAGCIWIINFAMSVHAGVRGLIFGAPRGGQGESKG